MSKVFISLIVAMLLVTTTAAQPYLDLLNIRYVKSPDAGFIHRENQPTTLAYFNISTTLPLQLKSKDVFIFSPYFERWQLNLAESNRYYYGLVLPVSFLKNLNDQWSLLSTAILRMNDSAIYSGMRHQLGGALIVSNKMQSNLTIKAGAYINSEFFGTFFMPLAGIDWQMSKKDAVFGVLPGNITYQHQVSPLISYGAAFRAQTNSYNSSNNNFTRIDENQLGAFADIYITKKIVLNFEGGHSLFRKIRTKKIKQCNCNNKYDEYAVNDNLYFKVAFAYRVKLRD